jgi:hypothetical protein
VAFVLGFRCPAAASWMGALARGFAAVQAAGRNHAGGVKTGKPLSMCTCQSAW